MKNKRQGGLIEIIVLIIIAILIFSYFNINLQSLVEQPTTQQNFSYVTSTSVSFWNAYLQKPALYLWNTVVVGLLWNSFINNMTQNKNAQPSTLQENSPGVVTEPATPSQ